MHHHFCHSECIFHKFLAFSGEFFGTMLYLVVFSMPCLLCIFQVVTFPARLALTKHFLCPARWAKFFLQYLFMGGLHFLFVHASFVVSVFITTGKVHWCSISPGEMHMPTEHPGIFLPEQLSLPTNC